VHAPDHDVDTGNPLTVDVDATLVTAHKRQGRRGADVQEGVPVCRRDSSDYRCHVSPVRAIVLGRRGPGDHRLAGASSVFPRRIGGAGGGAEKAIVGVIWVLAAVGLAIFLFHHAGKSVGTGRSKLVRRWSPRHTASRPGWKQLRDPFRNKLKPTALPRRPRQHQRWVLIVAPSCIRPISASTTACSTSACASSAGDSAERAASHAPC
jgi:hypothetical protein